MCLYELVPTHEIGVEYFSQISRIQQASVLHGESVSAVGHRDSFEIFCELHPCAIGGLAAGAEQHHIRIVASLAVR